MNRATKIGIIAMCVLLCGASIFLSSRARESVPPGKTKVFPIDNPTKPAKVWLWA